MLKAADPSGGGAVTLGMVIPERVEVRRYVGHETSSKAKHMAGQRKKGQRSARQGSTAQHRGQGIHPVRLPCNCLSGRCP